MGLGLIAAGVVSGTWGAATLLEARGLHDGADGMISQHDADALNRRIGSLNRRGATLLGVGIAALAGGALTLSLQEPAAESSGPAPARARLEASWDVVIVPGAVTGGIRGTF